MATFGFGVPYIATMPVFSYGLNPFYNTLTRTSAFFDTKTQKPSKYSQTDNTASDKKTNKGKVVSRLSDRGSGKAGWGAPSTSGIGNVSSKNSMSSTHTDKAVNDLAVSGLQDIGLDMAQAAALTAGLGTMVGATPSQVAQASMHSAFSSIPNALAGYAGRLGATALGAAPSTPVGKMSPAVVGGILGSIAGPIGGLLGGLIGPTVVGLAEDALGVRSMEDVRDALEDTVGTFSGRRMGQAFSDAYDKTKTVTPSFNYAVDSMSMSPTQKNIAKTSFSNALGKSFSSMSKDKLGDVARNIGVSPAAAYAGAMATLGSFGVETDPTGGLHGAVDSIAGTVSTATDAYGKAMSSFGGPTQGTQTTAPSDDRAAMAMSQAMSQAADQASAPGTATSSKASSTSTPDQTSSTSTSDTTSGGQSSTSSPDNNTGSGGGNEGGGWGDGGIGSGYGSDQGGFGTGVGGDIGGGAMSHGSQQGGFGGIGGYGDVGTGGWGSDSGGWGGGNEGGGGHDNEGGPNGGSDSQGTGEGQAGDGTGGGAEGQNDGGDDGGW